MQRGKRKELVCLPGGVWEQQDWWDRRAAECRGTCPRCHTPVYGETVRCGLSRAVVLHCRLCGREKVVLIQEAPGQRPVTR